MEVCDVEVDQVSTFVIEFTGVTAIRLCSLVGLCNDMSVFGKPNEAIDLLKEVSDGGDGAGGICWMENQSKVGFIEKFCW